MPRSDRMRRCVSALNGPRITLMLCSRRISVLPRNTAVSMVTIVSWRSRCGVSRMLLIFDCHRDASNRRLSSGDRRCTRKWVMYSFQFPNNQHQQQQQQPTPPPIHQHHYQQHHLPSNLPSTVRIQRSWLLNWIYTSTRRWSNVWDICVSPRNDFPSRWESSTPPPGICTLPQHIEVLRRQPPSNNNFNNNSNSNNNSKHYPTIPGNCIVHNKLHMYFYI